jgi:hypothetical protein
MGPWIVLAAFVAAINLLAFIAVRGRWGRLVPLLALAALAGTLGGDLVAGRIGIELVRIGDFHLVAASFGAQLAMLAVTLLSALGPSEVDG